jgi:hypothetical protein
MMNTPLLSLEERTTLLRLARQSITLAAARKPLPPLNWRNTPWLYANGVLRLSP